MHVMRAFATFSSESDQKSCCILLLLLMASSAMMNRMDSGRFHSLRGASLRPSHANRTAFSPAALPQSLLNKTLLRYRALPGSLHDGMSPDKSSWGEQWTGTLNPPPLSRPDAHFEAMGLEFVDTAESINIAELNEVFEKVSFPRRDPVKLKTALEHTYAIVWVRATKQSRYARLGQMVGFSRATSDGVLSATIWDVAVLPVWQRSGLGRAMMERLTRKLVEAQIPTITLYAEPTVVALYEKLGFVKDPEGIKGMAFQKKKLAAAAR